MDFGRASLLAGCNDHPVVISWALMDQTAHEISLTMSISWYLKGQNTRILFIMGDSVPSREPTAAAAFGRLIITPARELTQALGWLVCNANRLLGTITSGSDAAGRPVCLF